MRNSFWVVFPIFALTGCIQLDQLKGNVTAKASIPTIPVALHESQVEGRLTFDQVTPNQFRAKWPRIPGSNTFSISAGTAAHDINLDSLQNMPEYQLVTQDSRHLTFAFVNNTEPRVKVRVDYHNGISFEATIERNPAGKCEVPPVRITQVVQNSVAEGQLPSVTLQWEAPNLGSTEKIENCPEIQIVKYNIYRGLAGVIRYDSPINSVSTKSWQDFSVKPDSKYTYVVRPVVKVSGEENTPLVEIIHPPAAIESTLKTLAAIQVK